MKENTTTNKGNQMKSKSKGPRRFTGKPHVLTDELKKEQEEFLARIEEPNYLFNRLDQKS